MPVVALVGNKGGTGKTTLCVNIAAVLSKRAATIILDADPQRSSLQWRDLSDRDDALTVVDAVHDIDGAIAAANANHHYVVVDCPPSASADQTAQVLALCDLALVPVQPSPLDLWATVHIEGKVAEARRVNPGLHAVLVVNQLEPRTKLSRMVSKALTELGLPSAQTPIRRRVIYRSCVLEGRTVMDIGSRGNAAADEISQLIEEVIRA